jgi:polyhydroxybutyrate depolymerase
MRVGMGIAVAAGVLALPTTTGAASQAGVVMHWTIDGVQRDALVFVPVATNGSVRRPLVFGFHGHGGHMQGAAHQMHLQTTWPQAIVVYPQGLDTPVPIIDPSGMKPGWQLKAGDSNDRDLKLFDAMVATIKQHYNVNPKRIYTTGFSNGGVFSYLLWAERPNVIAAIGEVAGRLDPAETLTVPRALLAVAGKQDTTDPFAMQLASIEQARQANGATGPGTACGPGCTFYPSAGGNTTPVKTLIHPGGHVYPPWAPLQITKFFRAHPQP